MGQAANAEQTMQWSKPRMLKMEAELSGHLPGQDLLIRAIANAIRRNLALSYPNRPSRPVGSFLLIGPIDTATKVAISMAQFLYGDPKALLQLNMQDYGEKHNTFDLIGHNGGLVFGYCEGHLSEPVRRSPRRVILLEEAEKTYPAIWHQLLSIVSDGELIDGLGRKVLFSECVLLLRNYPKPPLCGVVR